MITLSIQVQLFKCWSFFYMWFDDVRRSKALCVPLCLRLGLRHEFKLEQADFCRPHRTKGQPVRTRAREAYAAYSVPIGKTHVCLCLSCCTVDQYLVAYLSMTYVCSGKWCFKKLKSIWEHSHNIIQAPAPPLTACPPGFQTFRHACI